MDAAEAVQISSLYRSALLPYNEKSGIVSADEPRRVESHETAKGKKVYEENDFFPE